MSPVRRDLDEENKMQWLIDEDDLLRSEYRHYGDAARLRPLLQNRNTAAIIKRANFIGLKTRLPQLKRYTLEELKSFCYIDARGCWNWPGSTHNGYGVMVLFGDRVGLHRMAFALANPLADITTRLICHKCDNRPCINPLHLYAGTYTDNNRDTLRRGRYRNQYSQPL